MLPASLDRTLGRGITPGISGAPGALMIRSTLIARPLHAVVRPRGQKMSCRSLALACEEGERGLVEGPRVRTLHPVRGLRNPHRLRRLHAARGRLRDAL